MPKHVFLATYTVCWISFCFLALFIMFKDRKQLRLEWRDYLRFLCVPWKLSIFALAFLFVTFAGHFTDDETWDIITGSVMSLLTFFTAPWSLGLVYKVVTAQKRATYLIVAMALCLFSASWFYDAYLFLRDGQYSVRWLGNLMLSPEIYVAAGFLWNLEAKGAWPTFGFLRSDWPKPPPDKRFAPLFVIALPLIMCVGVLLVSYVRWHW